MKQQQPLFNPLPCSCSSSSSHNVEHGSWSSGRVSFSEIHKDTGHGHECWGGEVNFLLDFNCHSCFHGSLVATRENPISFLLLFLLMHLKPFHPYSSQVPYTVSSSFTFRCHLILRFAVLLTFDPLLLFLLAPSLCFNSRRARDFRVSTVVEGIWVVIV